MRTTAMHSIHFRVLLYLHRAVSAPKSRRNSRAVKRTATTAYTDSGVLESVRGASTQTNSSRCSPLSSREVHKAALLARLSGLCYYPPEQLAGRLAREGMKLVINGGTSFTRWYVADGPLDRDPSENGKREAEQFRLHDSGANSTVAPASTSASQWKAETERVILLRGVVWQGQDVDAWKLWQDLMRFWPTAFAEDHTQPPGALLAHAGVADMAGRVYEALRMPVTEAQALNRRITFGGHSLGGSLALLLAVLFRLQHQAPAELVRCCTFGSPPVLSHGGGQGGDGVLKVLGLPKGALRSFVLENDPIPRALLSVDPTFTAFKQSRPGAALLRLRHWLLGPGVPLTPERFLADNVGDVHLIKWSADAGHKVIPLAPEEMEEQFRLVSGKDAPSTWQGMLDHAHGSYSLDLDAAARQLQSRGL